MVEYKKKILKLQNGGVRNYYSKLYKNGTEKKITKNEYLKKMSGGKSLISSLYHDLKKNIETLKNTNNNSDKVLHDWFNEKKDDIEKILKNVYSDGILRENNKQIQEVNLSATLFNDYYKWTMLPVIRYLETYDENIPIHVTFGVNIRTQDLREKLCNDKLLQNKVYEALKSLENRKFNREIFDQIIEFKNLHKLIDENTIDSICGPINNPRSLIDRVINEKYIPTKDKDEVVISFFKGPDSKLNKDRMFIEATGPWHKVTWLETTMMQAVYEVLLRDKLIKENKSYAKWLFEAMQRCSKSITEIKEIEKERNDPMKGALFTGRRTGGYAFILLQNLFVKDNYKNCIGTSSVDSWYTLKKKTGRDSNNLLQPVGTHAHELSMVISTLIPNIDDESNYPLTQLIGHYLYYLKSAPRGIIENKNMMPMLPDTLGTEAFVRAATIIKVPLKHKQDYNSSKNKRKNGELIPFLDIIGSARQDSGELKDFVDIMDKYNFEGSIMASEIDNIDTLKEASKFKRKNNKYAFQTFGAGGFFGDSEAAWNKRVTNISMAVKAVRVYVEYQETLIKPIKLGNSKSNGKLEINGLLNKKIINEQKKRATKLKTYKPSFFNDKKKIQKIFDEQLKYLGIN